MDKGFLKIAKASMSARERTVRSKLAQIISSSGMVRGTLTTRERVCGKSNCKCTRGEKHIGLYLVMSQAGNIRQLYVPKDREAKVRRWLEEYRQVQEFLEELCDLQWTRLQNRE